MQQPGNGKLAGRVVIITGAGRGLGREHALAFAREGAKVVVNDLGAELDGTGVSSGPAGDVVSEIRAAGHDAIANGDDISDPDGAHRLIDAAIDAYGDVHVLVNNAGILRDRMLANMTVAEFDDVIKVHLRGTFCMAQPLATRWREQSKSGAPVFGRIINTSSPSGLYGNVGQTNYAAAKAGIAILTMIWSQELGRYGDVTVNAIAPMARTRMTESIRGRAPEEIRESWDDRHPANVSPLAVWLATDEAASVTGRVFNVVGGHVSIAEPWRPGPSVDKGAMWEVGELGPTIYGLLEESSPRPV